MCVQSQSLCHVRARGKADESDLVAVNDHPDEVRDAAKKEKDKVELGGLALASKRRCSQTQERQRERTTGRTVE